MRYRAVNLAPNARHFVYWLVPQTNPAGVNYADATLTALKESQAVVPSLWALEIANVVSKVESRGIVTEADSQRFITLFGQLNIVTDQAKAASTAGVPIFGMHCAISPTAPTPSPAV